MSKRQKLIEHKKNPEEEEEEGSSPSDATLHEDTVRTSIRCEQQAEDALFNSPTASPNFRNLPHELKLYCLSFLPVETLETKTSLVSKDMKAKSEEAIGRKRTDPKSFETREELKEEAAVYTTCRYRNRRRHDPVAVERIARTYGWPINKWEVSRVEDFSLVFYDQSLFNGIISAWDVSNATFMLGMFHGASSFNQDLSEWNTENVTNISNMFCGARSFTGDLSGWNTSNVTDMSYMFYDAVSFNGDLSGWNVAKVTDMTFMFFGAHSFNQDLSRWKCSKGDEQVMHIQGCYLF